MRDPDRSAVADQPLSLDGRISWLRLGNKERHALDALGVRTVRGFLELDLRQVLGIRGYGAGTYARLQRSQDDARRLLSSPQDGMASAQIYLHALMEELRLSTRGVTTLHRLGVQTVWEFLSLNLDNLGRVAGCGVITHAELKRTQEEVWRRLPAGVMTPEGVTLRQAMGPAIREAAQKPVTARSWELLPLFSGQPANDISPKDLHESYRPSVAVEHLGLPKGASRALAARDIRSLGELLLTPGRKLLGPGQLSNGTLARTQALVDEFLRHSLNGASSVEVDWRTPDSLLCSLLRPVVTNERERAILLARMGCQSEPRKLEELAQEFGVTRERVRQIEKAGLRRLTHWRASGVLQPLHDLIRGMLEDVSPLMGLKAVGRQLQRRFGWQRPLQKEALVRLLPAFPGLRCTDGRYVCAQGFLCPECSVLPGLVDKVLTANPVGKLDLSELAEKVVEQVAVAEECRGCVERPKRASVNLVRLGFMRCSTVKGRYRLCKNEVWHVDQWRFSDGALFAAMEVTLKEHPGPMSYHDVQAAVNRLRGSKVTPEVVWRVLNSCVAHGSEILLWDRGGAYQHKCHVNLYAPLLNKIEKWVLAVLREGPFTQLSTNAAFQAFKEDCLAAGLTSEYAVHSCLKHRQHPKLAFFKSPYLGRAGATTYRVPNVEIAEELIRQEGHVVEYGALRHTLCDRMGMKRFQFVQIVTQFSNVIRTENGFLHADYFDADSAAFSALVDYVTQKLTREGQLSARLIYAEKRVSCLQQRIDGPRMLHSVLVQFAGEVVAPRSYPLLVPASSEDTAARSTVRDQVITYVRKQQQLVSCEELRQRFVTKQGFNYQTVMAVASTDSVVRYLNGMLVHVDTLGWTTAKQEQLVEVAERYYTEQVLAGGVFARADLLVELHEPDLPPLDHGVDWTQLLATELLSRELRVSVFGNRRNAFVFVASDQKPASFAEFIGIVLDKHFQGAASLAELSAFLRESGVIAKEVTPTMLKGSHNLDLSDHEIAVKGDNMAHPNKSATQQRKNRPRTR